MVEAFFFGVFGLLIGSFLNVFILRHGVRTLGGRSECMSCGRTLTWQDLVPVFSWLVLRGRCRTCAVPISIQYPLVEATTAISFAVVGGSILPLLIKVLALPIVALLIAIAVYDLKHTIIPDEWAYSLAGLSLVTALIALMPIMTTQSLLLEMFAGPLAASPLYFFWLISRGRWMGLGDAKLALGIGWLLGFPEGIESVFFAFIIGAVVSIFILLPLPYIRRWLQKRGITALRGSHKRFTMTSEVPFGPFLILSCLIVWFTMIYALPLPILVSLGVS